MTGRELNRFGIVDSVTVEVNVPDAKAYLAGLIERVAAGERVVITKAGEPVAELVPHEPESGVVNATA